MGWNINGYIEVWDDYRKEWEGVVDVVPLVDRDYDFFGLLFGVQNHTGLAPLTTPRGVPADVSRQAARELQRCPDSWFEHTWVRLDELHALNWDQVVITNREFWHKAGRTDGAGMIHQRREDLPDGTRWEENGEVHFIGTLTGNQLLAKSREWRVLLGILDVFGREHGDERVRLVVWFDA